MYTVGQGESVAQRLARAKQQATLVYSTVAAKCPQFVQSNNVAYFAHCYQQHLAAQLPGLSLGDALKVYVIGKKLAELAPIDTARRRKSGKYWRWEDRPTMEVSVSDYVNRYCSKQAQRGIIHFLRPCHFRYPGAKMSFNEFVAKFRSGQ